mgnify:CR=1 FL=1
MNEEEIKEYIRAKRTPVSSCVDLSKYFIGRHKVLPIYLTPQFEIEFNYKMRQLEQLKEQLQQKEDVINKAKVDLEKHLNAKSYGNHKYELFDRKYLEEVLEILDNKGE